ncbi:unnamed protein product [Haemonchus placei]|uniref:C-type lectin domain-containing protein n=1 Tax=Haemonchus placei TaxID=6290 RepID=A0A3P8BAS6_HAEPC|nr:unnamed protein product [Haemonchus placei]
MKTIVNRACELFFRKEVVPLAQAFEGNNTFDEAEAKCVAEGGHLVSIHSDEENDFVYGTLHVARAISVLMTDLTRFICSSSSNLDISMTKMVSKDYRDFTWIGLGRLDWPKDDKWKWTDGTPVDYLNWAPAEPDNIQRKEHCSMESSSKYMLTNPPPTVSFPVTMPHDLKPSQLHLATPPYFFFFLAKNPRRSIDVLSKFTRRVLLQDAQFTSGTRSSRRTTIPSKM